MGRLRSTFLSTSAIALLLALAAAPLAQAEWLPPVDVSATSSHTGNPHVVLDSEGNATAVWDRWNGTETVVESAFRPAGEGWETPIDLSQPELSGEVILAGDDASSPQIAVDRNGNVTVLWERYAGTKIVLQSVDRPFGGSWTALEDIAEVSQGAAPEPWIAVDWEGRATAVWNHAGVIETSFRPFAGSWEAPLPLSEGESFLPQAAMDARGDTTAVWMHFDGSHDVVESAYRPESGEWEEPTLVSQAGEDGGDPHVALDAKGDALVVWRGEDEGEEFVRAAYRPQGESWGAPTDVSAPGEQVEALRDAVDPAGNAIVAWGGDMGKAGEHRIAHAAFKPVAGSWEAPIALSAEGANAFPSDVVFDTSGNAALVWQRWDGVSDVVQAAYRPAGAEWEPAVNLSEAGKRSFDPVVVLDAPGESSAADGNATAVWVTESEALCEGEKGEESCASSLVQAAGYDPEGRPEVELELPAEGTVGEPVEISTPTEGLFAPLLEFGDGGSVAATGASHVYDKPGEYEVTLGGAEVLGYRASAKRMIRIAAKASTGEPESPGGGGGASPSRGAVSGSPGAAGASSPPAPASTCAAARASLAKVSRQLGSTRAKLRRASPSQEQGLAAAVKRQIGAVRRARARAAHAC